MPALLPWLALAAVALSGTATAFLGVVAAATFALLGSGDVARAAAAAWPALPAATQALSYGGSADDMARSQKAEFDRWGPLIKTIGFTAES